MFWDFKTTEVVESKIKPLKMDKVENATVRVNRTLKAAAGEVKIDDMTSVLMAINTVSRAAIDVTFFWLSY